MTKVFKIALAATIAMSLTGCDAILSSTAAAGSYEAGKIFATAIPKEQLDALNLLDPEVFCAESATVAEGTATIEGFSTEEFAKGCLEVLNAK